MSLATGLGLNPESVPFLNFNWGYTGIIVSIIFLTVLIAIPIGGIIISLKLRKNKKYQYRFKIPIFMEVNGKRKKVDTDNAKEIYVPNSNISLFFLKRKKIYIPRPTRTMGENEFWYSISENGEWINFDLANNPDKNTLSEANYDHRDTRYAYTNLKEIIKRNYSDKAVTWWKEYSGVISLVIILVVFTGCMIFIISRFGNVISQLKPLTESLKEIAEILRDTSINTQNINSGIIKAS